MLTNLQEAFKAISELLEPVFKNSQRTGRFPERYDSLNILFVFKHISGQRKSYGSYLSGLL